MDKQAREAREMAKKLSFKEKIKHFWYYYKIHTISAVIAALVIGISIYQVVTRPKYDLEITYYGSELVFNQGQADMLEDYLSEYIEDIDGDGEKNVNIFLVSSSLGNSIEYKMAINQKLMAELASGNSMVYIFDTDYFTYAGPDTDVGAFNSSIKLSEIQRIKEMLGLDEPVYWCTKLLYEREEDNEKVSAMHNNALIAERILGGFNIK